MLAHGCNACCCNFSSGAVLKHGALWPPLPIYQTDCAIGATSTPNGSGWLIPGCAASQALAACKKEVHHHMKKLKKLQHAVTADAEAFAEMVSPDGWGVLMERALHGAASLQKKIEGAAQEEARRRFAAELAQAVAAADAAKDKWRKEHERRKALHNQVWVV